MGKLILLPHYSSAEYASVQPFRLKSFKGWIKASYLSWIRQLGTGQIRFFLSSLFKQNELIVYIWGEQVCLGKHNDESVSASVTIAELATTQPINSMILNGQPQTNLNGINIQNGLATQTNAKVATYQLI